MACSHLDNNKRNVIAQSISGIFDLQIASSNYRQASFAVEGERLLRVLNLCSKRNILLW